MALIKCPDCGRDISDAAPVCLGCGRPIAAQGGVLPVAQPPEKKKSSPLAIGCLAVLVAFVALWVIGKIMSGGSSDRSVGTSLLTGSKETQAPTGPMLELIKSHWYTEYGYAIYEGQVKNISSQPLKNVEAVATFYDSNGQFITSSDALIDYNPILPGQISPFKVMKTENPAMKKASVEFKYLSGGSILYRDAEVTKPNKKK